MSITVLRSLLWSAMILPLAACVSPGPPIPPQEVLPRETLVSGAALWGAPVSGQPISAEAVLSIDGDMRAFVRDAIGDAEDPDVKLERLLDAMRDRGLLSLDYLRSATQTVQETFHRREGNCLSFTMLFVALAREAGLEVSYQMVDIPPSWTSEGDVVMRTNHINTLVSSEDDRRQFIVDFNSIDVRGNYDTRRVSDGYALALYYSNIGAAAFIEGDYETSLIYFRRAIEAYPDVSGAWTNLGVLYSRHGLHEHAESAYLAALAAEPRDPSVLTNLAILYNTMGNEQLADVYRDRVRYYRLRNPYYHYSLALEAYDERRFGDVLTRLRKAIRLKEDEHQFYFLRGLTYFELGKERRAQLDFDAARRYAQIGEIRQHYEYQILALSET